MALVTLVYVSVATHTMSDPDLLGILDIARRFNADNNITGMLLYHDGIFMQALEGEERTVDALYERIRRDPRHRNVLTLLTTEIMSRAFSSFTMGFNRVVHGDGTGIDGFSEFFANPDPGFLAHRPDRAMTLLHEFRQQSQL